MTARAILTVVGAVALGCAGAVGKGRDGGPGGLSGAERAYLADGDADRAESLLRAAIARDPEDGGARFLLADLLDALGRPGEAADLYFGVLDLGRKDARLADVAAASSAALVAIRDRVDGFPARFAAWADAALADPGALPAEAVWELRNLRFAVAMRREDDAATRRRMLDASGCLSRWEAIGPFGPRALESLDRLGDVAPWFAGGGRWPSGAALGPGRGEAPVRAVDATRCAVPAFDPGARAPGLGLARTVVGLDRGGTILFRLEADASAKVYAGGVEIFAVDRRERWLPRYEWFAAELPAGNTEISVAVAHPGAAPAFSLSAVREDDGAALFAHGPGLVVAHPAAAAPHRGEPAHTRPPGDGGTATRSLAQLRIAIWRRDDPAARSALEGLSRSCGPDAPVLTAAAAQVALADPDQPLDVAFEAARVLMERALGREPRLWEARLLLARAEAGDGRAEAAVDLVGKGRALCPEEPAIAQRLVELYEEAGYAAEADEAARELVALVPGSCAALARELAVGRGALAPAERLALAEGLAACDRTSDALAEALLDGQRFDGARAEYGRLSERDPEDPALADAEARAALAAGDAAAFLASARRVVGIAPGGVARRLALADGLAASGRREEARAVIEGALMKVTPGDARAVDALAALGGAEPYAAFRVDGLAAVEAYRSSAPRYDTGSVWVLDRAVQIVGRDGSRTEITHNIAALLSARAVAEHGEIEVPDGAALLTARAIKADGTVRAPERVEGKASVSLTDLAPGDFVEVEYATRVPPSPIFPGGFDTGRFFFASSDAAFHRSEMVLVAPEGMPLELDPRGAAPAPEETAYRGLRVLQWRVRGASPLAAEPFEPDPAERLPSIRVTSGASPGAICGGVRELVAGGDRSSPEIEALARELVSGLPESGRSRLAALYGWVMENVVDDGELGGEVSHVVARRAGSRARAFLALARAVGLEGRLAFVRPAASDDTPGAIADPGIAARVAVLAGGEWLSFETEAAPSGFLPPELRHRPALFPDRCEPGETGGGAVSVDSRRVSMTVRLGAGGEATAEVEEELVGGDAIAWRAGLRGVSPAERERAFAESYVSRVAPGAAVARLTFTGLEADGTPLVIRYALSLAGFARAGDGSLRGPLPFPRTLLRDVGGRSTRQTPAVLAVYDHEEISITVLPPEGMAISTRAADGTAESGWGRAARRAVRRGEALEIRLELDLEAGRVAPKDYPAFAAFAAASDALFAIEVEAGGSPPLPAQLSHSYLTPETGVQ